MKRVLCFVCLLFCLISNAQAHSQPPITNYVQFSKTVCIAKAITVDKGVVTFTVEESVKRNPPRILKSTVACVPLPITENSEWLLAQVVPNKNTVGWAMKGDYGWVNAPVECINREIRLAGNYAYVNGSLAKDPSFKCLTLEQLKHFAKQPLPQN